MTREPETPRTDDGPAGDSEITDIPAGRRFSGSQELLDIESELIAEGQELPNRAIPTEYHPEHGDYDYSDPAVVADLLDAEVGKEEPNKSLIGLLNEYK